MLNAIIFHFKRTKQFGLRSLFFYLKTKVKKNKLDDIKLIGIKYPVSLSNLGPDMITLFQIFFSKEYQMPFPISPKVIIDCGANIGLSAVYYANKYPQAKIISIEPDADNFKFLQKNTSLYPNVICLNKAVWSERNYIQLIDIGTGNWSLQSKEVDAAVNNSIEAIGIQDLIDEYNITEIGILKVDIEGAEKQLFSVNYKNWLSITHSIAIELHPNIDIQIPDIFNNAIKDLNCKKYFSGENMICDLRKNN